jgi:hypothetical protein
VTGEGVSPGDTQPANTAPSALDGELPPKNRDLIDQLDAVLKDALGREFKRKSSIEGRGFAVITSSGALASLIFAISAFVSQGHAIQNFSHDEAVFIRVSVVCFLAAAVAGVLINVPVRYGLLKAHSIWTVYEHHLMSKDPSAASADFHDAVVSAKMQVLHRTQFWNWIKSEILLAAFIAEVAGILSLTVAVFLVLNTELG